MFKFTCHLTLHIYVAYIIFYVAFSFADKARGNRVTLSLLLLGPSKTEKLDFYTLSYFFSLEMLSL